MQKCNSIIPKILLLIIIALDRCIQIRYNIYITSEIYIRGKDMGKTLKSVKVDNDLLKIVDMYTSLMKSISGGVSTFTTMVEEGVSLYLLEQIKMLRIVMQNKIILENGVLKELPITKEQIEKIEDLIAELAAYRSDNQMGGIVVGTDNSRK